MTIKMRKLHFGLLTLMLASLLLADGCAQIKPMKEKEPPCLIAPGRIVGIYGTRLSLADSPGRMIRLRLAPGHRADLITESLDGKPAVIENGQWECHSTSVTVKLTGRIGQTYEKPEDLIFTLDNEGLKAVQYDRENLGGEGLHLLRNPDVMGKVWRLVQIQYPNNTAVVPDDPAKYALILSQDGTVTVRADCNRGMGTFLMAGPWLVMKKLSYTHMICMENSLFDQYTKALETAVSCRLIEGSFYVTIGPEGGVMKFKPAVLEE